MTIRSGTLLVGKYKIIGAIAEGGMATIFEAEHIGLGQLVAIKMMHEHIARDPALVARFEREGRVLSRLRGPNVVRVQDVDVTPAGAPFMVMEKLEGRDLDQELSTRGPLPIAEAVSYVIQASTAMIEAHDLGLVHRDLKPSNLFLADYLGTRTLKVIDFGIARTPFGQNARLTQAAAVIGTPLYMAPEQFLASADVDARADVWALGATLYELLAGRPPFLGSLTTVGVAIVNEALPAIEKWRPDVQPALRSVLAIALAKDRDARYGSMRRFADALGPFSGGVLLVPRASAPSFHDGDAEEMRGSTQVAIAAPASAKVAAATPASASLAVDAPSQALRRGGGRTASLAAALVIAVTAGWWLRSPDGAPRARDTPTASAPGAAPPLITSSMPAARPSEGAAAALVPSAAPAVALAVSAPRRTPSAGTPRSGARSHPGSSSPSSDTSTRAPDDHPLFFPR